MPDRPPGCVRLAGCAPAEAGFGGGEGGRAEGEHPAGAGGGQRGATGPAGQGRDAGQRGAPGDACARQS